MTAPTTDATEMVKPKYRVFTPGVFWPSAILILIFVFLAIFWSEGTKERIDAISSAVVDNVGWYYILAVSGFVVFALAIAFSRKGDTILGADDAKPEYSRLSWFSMLFAAGMGIGLVFWGAAEPLNHYGTPKPGGRLSGEPSPTIDPVEQQERASEAMNTTFLHWGLHAWAVYVVVGLAVAYAVHRKGLPVSMRWTLKPILGDRVNGRLGDVIDVIAIIGTLFGISTSLGSGVGQVGEGLNFLWDWEVTPGMLVTLVVVISGLAALSVATGLDAGIKFLSNTNLVLAALLMLGVFTLGPTLFISNEFVSGLGQYFQNFIGSSLDTLSFSGSEGSSWLQGWTVYYWGWWISWSPFVGIFIARISKGRTVREFIAGVLLVPTLITFIWFAILGGNGLYQEVFGDANLVSSLLSDNEGSISDSSALFAVFESMPIPSILSTIFCIVAIILVIIFFVTSSDSGSYVMSMIATGGNPNPALRVRLTFAVLAGSITAAMLGWSDDSAAALSALRNLAILAALPFSVILILMCWATWKELRAEQMLRRWAERVEFAKTLSEHVSSEVTTGIYSDITSHRSKARPIETTVDLRRFFERLSRKHAESAEESSGSTVKTQDVYEVPDVATGPEGPSTTEIAADYEAYLTTTGFISSSSDSEDEAPAEAQASEQDAGQAGEQNAAAPSEQAESSAEEPDKGKQV